MSPPYVGVTNKMLGCSILNINTVHSSNVIDQVASNTLHTDGLSSQCPSLLIGFWLHISTIPLWPTAHTREYSNCVGTLVSFISWPGLGRSTGVCQASVHNSSHRSDAYASVYLMSECFISQVTTVVWCCLCIQRQSPDPSFHPSTHLSSTQRKQIQFYELQ